MLWSTRAMCPKIDHAQLSDLDIVFPIRVMQKKDREEEANMRCWKPRRRVWHGDSTSTPREQTTTHIASRSHGLGAVEIFDLRSGEI